MLFFPWFFPWFLSWFLFAHCPTVLILSKVSVDHCLLFLCRAVTRRRDVRKFSKSGTRLFYPCFRRVIFVEFFLVLFFVFFGLVIFSQPTIPRDPLVLFSPGSREELADTEKLVGVGTAFAMPGKFSLNFSRVAQRHKNLSGAWPFA